MRCGAQHHRPLACGCGAPETIASRRLGTYFHDPSYDILGISSTPQHLTVLPKYRGVLHTQTPNSACTPTLYSTVYSRVMIFLRIGRNQLIHGSLAHVPTIFELNPTAEYPTKFNTTIVHSKSRICLCKPFCGTCQSIIFTNILIINSFIRLTQKGLFGLACFPGTPSN